MLTQLINNCNPLSFQFWFDWFFGLLIVLFLIIFIGGIIHFIYRYIICDLFESYCKKKGYVKIENNNDGEVV